MIVRCGGGGGVWVNATVRGPIGLARELACIRRDAIITPWLFGWGGFAERARATDTAKQPEQDKDRESRANQKDK